MTLKPSPFPPFGLTNALNSAIEPTHTPLSAQASSAVSVPDRLSYYTGSSYGSHTSSSYPHSYAPTPSTYAPPTLGSTPGLLGRPGSWSQQSSTTAAGTGGAPTAITALLTENKCPRHATSGYCVGGNCLS